ncbi:hypothetical protein [Clostridium cellulovorans]|uniref:Uncharacterized protein n=1 Tax=Clostridium cellulovorans (strain ATCC 35296 / DSM 3052 / OCM 3 / 743B) TaxID=573061 RepID=D9SV12_CLOC7|nr:hypothetical protein [Clostridium cellulovorans]ADL52987.1 hypothetical protein Clocel_3306 [Clostridium cellulovorans 743B]
MKLLNDLYESLLGINVEWYIFEGFTINDYLAVNIRNYKYVDSSAKLIGSISV